MEVKCLQMTTSSNLTTQLCGGTRSHWVKGQSSVTANIEMCNYLYFFKCQPLALKTLPWRVSFSLNQKLEKSLRAFFFIANFWMHTIKIIILSIIYRAHTHMQTDLPEALQLSWQVQLHQFRIFLHMCFTWKVERQYIAHVSTSDWKNQESITSNWPGCLFNSETEWLKCTHLSMVPNSHLGSLLKGITIWWNRANLVAISAEMSGSDSCSVHIRVF